MADTMNAKRVAMLFSLVAKGERSTFLGILDYAGRHEPWFCLFDECWSGERRRGFSVHDEIVRERIDCVKALLMTGDLSIGEITERTNFARESHLAKLFKRVTGITMTEWRRENRDTR